DLQLASPRYFFGQGATGVTPGDGVWEPVGVIVPDGVASSSSSGVNVAEGVADGVRVADGVAVTLGVAVSVADGVALGVSVADGEAVIDGVIVTVVDNDGVGVLETTGATKFN